MNRRAQQEIAGFVLIVVVVVIAVFMYLLYSIGNEDLTNRQDSLEVDNMISSVLSYTTECAIVREPDYDDFQDLFNSCYLEKRCSNLGIDSCSYLNSSLNEALDKMFETESRISSYQLDFYENLPGGGVNGILRLSKGECNLGQINSALRNLGVNELAVTLKVCYFD